MFTGSVSLNSQSFSCGTPAAISESPALLMMVAGGKPVRDHILVGSLVRPTGLNSIQNPPTEGVCFWSFCVSLYVCMYLFLIILHLFVVFCGFWLFSHVLSPFGC